MVFRMGRRRRDIVLGPGLAAGAGRRSARWFDAKKPNNRPPPRLKIGARRTFKSWDSNSSRMATSWPEGGLPRLGCYANPLCRRRARDEAAATLEVKGLCTGELVGRSKFQRRLVRARAGYVPRRRILRGKASPPASTSSPPCRWA